MDARILFQDSLLEISDFSYSKEDAENGNHYNCSFDLRIVSGLFSGIAPCEYDIKNFRRFATELEEMYSFKRKVVEFNDICYGSKVVFELDKIGHIKISGEIYGEAMIQSLKFEFVSDQTVLKSFSTNLSCLCNKCQLPSI